MRTEEYSPSHLAYLGDAVFELLVRERLLSNGSEPVGVLHKKAKEYVSATAQSDMFTQIYGTLSPDEQAVLRRGRNTHTSSKARHTSQKEYQYATGLEALFGYLYMKGDTDRLETIFSKCIGGS